MDVVAEAEDSHQATAVLKALLNLVDDVQAVAILDLQVRRWSKAERSRIEQERAELRAALET